MVAAAPAESLLLSLCEEIHQTSLWLGAQEAPPPPEELRARIQTLREAAMVADAPQVERELAELEHDLVSHPESTQKGSASLRRLSEALAKLERAQAESGFEWLEQLERVSHTLQQMQQHIRSQAQKLAVLSQKLLQNPSSAWLYAELLELARQTETVSASLRQTSSLLEATRGNLGGLATRQTRVSLTPMLQRLREHTRQVGSDSDRPAALLIEGGACRLHPACLEPLENILRALLNHLIRKGLEPAQVKRKRDRSSVATCLLRWQAADGLVCCRLSAEGVARLPPPPLEEQLSQPLQRLRGRLSMCSEELQARLQIDFPDCWGVQEALPVTCALGNFWICLSAVKRVFSQWREQTELERIGPSRSQDLENMSQGLLLTRAGHNFLLPVRVDGPPRWIVVRPPESEAPPWIGGVIDRDGERPVCNHLHWIPFNGEETCLFP